MNKVNFLLLIGWAGIINMWWATILGVEPHIFLVPMVWAFGFLGWSIYANMKEWNKAKQTFMANSRKNVLKMGLMTAEEYDEKVKTCSDAEKLAMNILDTCCKKLLVCKEEADER